MPYDPIQGNGYGRPKVAKLLISKPMSSAAEKKAFLATKNYGYQ